MRKQLLTLLMAVILFLLPSINFGQTAPNLGTTSSFALFTAAGAFTVNGASTVTGDVGTNADAFSGFGTPGGSPGTLIGNIHWVNPTSAQAATDVGTAYAELEQGGAVIAVGLGGQTLTPGVYTTGAAATLEGNLTLNGAGIYVIRIGGALSVGAGAVSDVILTGGATWDNVYWQIGGAFDLGAGSVSTFRGTGIVNGAINLYGTSTLIGRGLSTAGAININNNNVSLGELTWDGSTDTNWHIAANWDANVVPTVDYNVTIPSGLTNYPTLSSAGACNNLTIQSASGSTGSLIAQSYLTVYGTVTIQRYMPDAVWHMMGSPLTGQTINSTFLNANSIIGMKDYIEGNDNWKDPEYVSSPPNTTFTLGKGYATRRNVSGTVNLTGAPNTAIVEVTLTKGAGGYGWNLLSNPFTSAIAANIAGGANNLITNNAAILNPSYTALYIWNGSAYVIINHSGGAPGVTLSQNYLQVGQGFFVKSTDPASGTTFKMSPAMQSHQPLAAFKSSSADTWTGITLTAETSAAKASTQISYQENMSRGLDVGYDAGIMKSNPNFSLYSRLVEDNGIDFGIQCLPRDYENLVIPIGLDAKSGDIIKFTAQTNNLPTEYIAYLEDRTLGLFTNLSTNGAEYSIQLISDSKGTGRFFIRTSIESALGIGDLDLDNPFKVFTRPNNNQIVIRGEANANTIARIYSVTGKQVAGFNLKQSSENLVQFNEEAGIYIVKISNEQGTSTQKFAWVK